MASATIDRRGAELAKGVLVTVHDLYGGSLPLRPLELYLQVVQGYDVQPFRFKPRQQEAFRTVDWNYTKSKLVMLSPPNRGIRYHKATKKYMGVAGYGGVAAEELATLSAEELDERLGKLPQRSEYRHKRQAHQRNALFALHVAAMGAAGVACAWLALFPISPGRLYNMQVDVFRARHEHAEFFFGSCLYLGNVLGAAGAGYCGDRLGRAGTLELASIPFILGWVMVGVAYGELTVLIGRYLLGAAAGIIYVIVPVYLAEVSAAHTRGRVFCSQALLSVLGILCYLALGALFTYLSRQYLGFNLSEWKVLALSGVIPALAVLLFSQKLPDSPAWLIARHDDRGAAFDVLYRLFDRDERIAEDETNAIIHAKVLAASDRRHHGAFFRPVLLCATLYTLRAVSVFLLEPAITSTLVEASSRGVGGTHHNASFVLTIFGIGVEGAEEGLIAVSTAIAVAATMGVVACFFLVDTRGRPAALCYGCYVVALACAFLLVGIYRNAELSEDGGVALSDSGWAAMLLVVAGHQLGLGVVPVILVSELFAVKQRMGAVSLVVIWEAIVNIGLAHALPALRDSIVVVRS
ncbi:hypothetical protein BBJ29_000211 [Phytophthora kernoviae]|uniref:Major facilitator superfamily (MFS) profile domain-containing protein n=1 Tax=Phytophthora kernoviae TaxID=325452 RepID=A0A3F2S359_9STRA|nr:hypothetical protein BBP00_00000397 [Phytophthora kernoviae]RLN70690.1 hypothetical protein BBJ29_000211 [Phytophthora kernoviae]